MAREIATDVLAKTARHAKLAAEADSRTRAA
jgi:hypothetical protein